MKFYQTAKIINGKIVRNREEFIDSTLDILEEGTSILITYQTIDPQSTAKEYTACYFAKIDVLKNEIGDDRYSVHRLVKDNILVEMLATTPSLFKEPTISTKSLTLEGWKVLLERLDLWAFTEFNTIL